jgi:hypothetical protein
MGPLHTRKAQLRAESLIQDAVGRGANVRNLAKDI